jgi:hypothetical protein
VAKQNFKKSAKPKTAGKSAKARGKGGGVYIYTLVGLIVVALMMFATPAFVLFMVGIVPAMVAVVVDREPGRNASLAVAATNIAGVAPFVVELLINGPTMARAMSMLTDVFVLAVMYGTAAIGWGLVLGMPKVAAVYINVTNEARIQVLRREQKRLVDEWGEAVKEFPAG